ncbi:MAG: hypothetical protein ACI4J0_09550 [Huintestinicola sp.]|uniref:hypothetical protein n=1 Tax=Huintestinicola sp. TaxID=2981661 RepID=UPI003F0695E3
MYGSNHKYDDILMLSRPISEKHMPMPRPDRAAQFSSFAALSGYDEAVGETARLTDGRIEIDEDRAAELNDKLNILRDNLYERPEIAVTYFVPDSKKSGGKYVTFRGNARAIDEYERTIIFVKGGRIPLDDILTLGGDIYKDLAY